MHVAGDRKEAERESSRVSSIWPAARSGGSHRRPNTVRTPPARLDGSDVPCTGALSDVVLAVNQAEDLQAAMREVLRVTLRAMDFASGGVYVVAGI